MRSLTSLNALYREYQDGNLGRRDFEGEIFKVLLENLPYFRLFDGNEEESIDYLCWLYPRLSKAVENYRDNGAAFSTYISALVRYSTKEYRSRQIDHCITEYAAWSAQALDLEVRSPAYEYLPKEDETISPRFPAPALPKSRQILLLILRSYFFVSDDFVEKIAPFAGVEKERLIEMIEKLRDLRSGRDEAIRQFQERITTQFYRCITWENQLKGLLPGSPRYEKIQGRLERAKKRLARMRIRFSGLKVDATHRQIAEVMGISAGTVSSSLFSLKSRWETDQDGQLAARGNGEKKPGRGDDSILGGGGRFGLSPGPDLSVQDSKGDVEGDSGGNPGQGVCQADPGKAETGDQEECGNHTHYRFQNTTDGGGGVFAHTLHGAAEDQHKG
jgi:hypothetical protein